MPAAKTTGLELKRKNRNNIYHTLLKSEALSRQDLVHQLQLSLPTVTQNITDLLAEGLIAETGSFGNTGGRRAKAYSAVNAARVAIGLDITRHHITAVIVNLDGQVIRSSRVRHDFALAEAYFRKLGSVVRDLVSSAGINEQIVLGVGLAVPGLITEDHQTVFYGKILDFTGTTCQTLSQFIPFPSALYNDANAAGYAEIHESEDTRNAFYILLSNNIGGSVLINNRVYTGENLRSGEIGHMTIVPDGLACYCGQKGCVEAYCNAKILSGRTDDNLAEFFSELRRGNPEFRLLWQHYLQHLAIAVNNLRLLFDCKIIIGGYVGAYMDDYIADLKHLAAERSTFESNADYLQVCKYKTEAIAAGAALPFISDFTSHV